MNDQAAMMAMLRRLNDVERQMAKIRVGEVTSLGPLAVALGGSDVPYDSVKSVIAVEVGDIVVAVMWGHDMVVLGRLGDGGNDFARIGAVKDIDNIDTGVVSVNGGAAVGANGTFSVVVSHGLGVQPASAIVNPVSGGTFLGSLVLDAVTARSSTSVTLRMRFVNGSSCAASSTARFLVTVFADYDLR